MTPPENTISAPLTPEARLRLDRRGRPIEPKGEPLDCGESGTWILPRAATAREFDVIRDRLFDDMAGSASVGLTDIFLAAWSLIQKHYDLTGMEATQLLARAERSTLCDTVVDVLLVPDDPPRRYGDWVRASLVANGLDPATIAADDLPHVLFTLEKTGRCVPLGEFVSIGRRVAFLAAHGLIPGTAPADDALESEPTEPEA